MKYIIITIILLGCKMPWAQAQGAAKGPQPSASDIPLMTIYDNLAKDICNCAKDILSINSEIRYLHERQNGNGLVRLKAQIPDAYKEFNTCMARLEKKYKGKNVDEDHDAAYAALKKHCPGLVELMETKGLD
jgi:hypothetical protein